MNLNPHFSDLRIQIDGVVQNYLTEIIPRKEVAGLIDLHRSIGYSLTGGGSRFRPLLVCLAAETLLTPLDLVLEYGLALELVHTYSLIHDDLPSMDNDDFRRGIPTNHKKFSEPMAILAGDALCTEAYRVISEKYKARPRLALRLINILANASGPKGMVGGQAIDVCFKNEKQTQSSMEFLHQCKTVALFRAAVLGVAAISNASREHRRALDLYAQSLGMLFQIADDIKDGGSSAKNEPSFIDVVGLEKARNYCQNLKDSAIEQAMRLPQGAPQLQEFVQMIFERAK